MQKILMYSPAKLFTNNQTGGTKRFIELTKYMQKFYSVDLCCQDNSEILETNELKAKFQFKEATTNVLNWLPPEARRLLHNRKLIQCIKQENYDSVICFDVPPTIGLCLFGVKNIVLMIRKDLIGYERVTNQNQNTWRQRSKLAYLWLCEEICLRKVKCIITQCEYDKQQLLKRHKRLAKRIEPKFRIQINNVNPSWIQSKSVATNVATRDEGFRVCFIGNFNDERKGHRILLEAARMLQNKSYDIEWEIIGAGHAMETFRDMYENEKIKFHGRLDNPIKLLKECSLLVVPSYADSCPNTVMEALYNAIPVIGSRAGGIPEILQDDEFMFELTADSIAERIQFLYNNRTSLKKMKEKQGQRKEELQFDWAEKISTIILDKKI